MQFRFRHGKHLPYSAIEILEFCVWLWFRLHISNMLPMSADFDGIDQKLIRAHENIVNLKVEIQSFIDGGKYPVIPHPDSKGWQEVIDYHRNKVIPKRFSVLSGEIIHHLRAILDHIVWLFSDDLSRRTKWKIIEFPIFESRPMDKERIHLYERKIQGIKQPEVRNLIDILQPYHAGKDIADNGLLIIHNMDRFDKHRELVIVDSTAMAEILPAFRSPDIGIMAQLYNQGELPKTLLPAFGRAVKNYSKVTPQVSFRNFGRREAQPVIPGLEELLRIIRDVVAEFRKYV